MNIDKKLEKLEKANELAQAIAHCKRCIRDAQYTQNTDVVERQMHLFFNGIDNGIDIPPSLFRIVGKLVLLELKQNLIEFEKELDELL